MAKSPGKDKRKKKQRARQRFGKLRTELEERGEIAVTPEGALQRPGHPHVNGERVKPEAQGEQLIVDIPLQAARKGWATPEHKKSAVVDELVKLVESEEVKPFDKVLASNALNKLDQTQWERDHPEEAGKAKGGGTTVPIQINTGDLIGEALRRVEAQKQQVVKELNDGKEETEQADGAQEGGRGPARQADGGLQDGGREGQ